ncbi:molybdate ABC transporter substrate-binding protein [Aquibacillus kalidii]|uniref:molybdate ABC transporter substrate-binding protein n=1 Tax=Aquibacillus kalidii TaxID=2762597 RepID=UPI0016478099|nr:molybdate ABC transporter substrate-binding protein [Aquibacillus kalidii]
MLRFKLKKKLRHFTTEVSEELKNETLVLIGHSGCGKSTMLKMLSGLLAPDDGYININGKTLYNAKESINLPPEEREIGYVFQNYALFPHLTVRRNVEYGLSTLSRQQRNKRVDDTLAFLEIEQLADSKPHMLSGGEQQRVALARALVTKPDVLLLDEPLSALDVSTRSRVRLELKQLLKQLDIPTIIVTHDFEDARILGDKVAVMDRGEIIQAGSQADITNFPASPFVAQFTGTNLMNVTANESGSEHVAFDPWKVKVYQTQSEAQYEWKGTIGDISYSGAFVRLQIIEANQEIPIHADIPIELFQKKEMEIGEVVYAWIKNEDARPLNLSPNIIKKFRKKESYERKGRKLQETKKPKKAGIYIIPLLILLIAIGSFAYNSNSNETGQKVELFALVAANATEPFKDLMKEFETNHPNVDVKATFAGTQIVRTQLEQGANADIFLSADLGHIEAVKKQDLINEFQPVSLNSVTMVVPKNNPRKISSLEDLGSKDLKLVIGTDTVPIGRYSRQVIKNASDEYGQKFPDKVMDNVVSLETNVKQVLQKVSLGEAEVGMVYPTDVTPDFAKKVKKIKIPDKFNIVATNYISVTKKAPNKKLAKEFVEMMLSDKGQKIFKKYGYKSVNE